MSTSQYTTLADALSPKEKLTSTPPSQPIPGREADMAVNNTGGFSFVLDMWGVLDRFIMIGSEGGGAYVGEKDVTKQAFENTFKCIAADGIRVVNRVVEYSVAGRAPKNDPALVILALCAAKGDSITQAAAYEALPKVARIGTHLFLFVSVLNALGKWNAAAKRGVAAWYTNRAIDKLAVQVLKYQQRNGWAHRDVLRLAHVKPQNPAQDALLHWVTKAKQHKEGLELPKLVLDYEALQAATSEQEVLRLLAANDAFSWEMLPTQFLKSADVLMALLPNMGLTAMIRFLGRLSANGATDSMSAGQKLVINKLSNGEELRKSRVHPLLILQAMKQYAAGHGEKGSLVWTPNQRIVDALDDAFYESFTNVEDTGMGHLLGLDCSGSMWWVSSKVNGSPNLVAAEVAACFSLGLVKRQSNYWIGAFGTSMKELKISPNMRLDAVMAAMQGMCMGGTDCAQPMKHALTNRMSGVDLFTVITDNEINSGDRQPAEALKQYRKAFVPTAKLAVMATSLTQFTIADPKDGGQLDIAGFDSATPAILADFAMKR
jgi:60 kDa SS-A/Ro ribonucleoprotein